MTNHYKAVGFPFDSVADVVSFCRVSGQFAKWIPTDHGYYLNLGPDQGVEWWGQADQCKKPIGGHPHYVGVSRLRLRVERVYRSESSLDATLVANLVDGERGGDGPPLAISVPDFALFHPMLGVGVELTIQLAAFAERVELFANPAAFHASSSDYQGLASQAMIPNGLFTPDGALIDPPQPRVILTGVVRAVEQRHNSFSKLPFWVVSIDSLGGLYDVVVEPDLLDSVPQPGNVLAGVYYLSGQCLPDLRRKRRGERPLVHPYSARPECALDGVSLWEIFESSSALNRYALVGFGTALAGLLCFPFAFVGIFLNGFLWFLMSRLPAQRRRWMVATGTILSLVITAFWAALAAISTMIEPR